MPLELPLVVTGVFVPFKLAPMAARVDTPLAHTLMAGQC